MSSTKYIAGAWIRGLESRHRYIAAWCMSQKRYIRLYGNCLYSRVKFSVDRSSYNVRLILF